MNEIIELNEHRLLCGDATNRKDVDRLIGDCKVNLLLTDPPYGIDIVKIGGGKSADKADTQLDHSNERERESNGINRWSKTTNLQNKSEQSEHQQDQDSKEPQKRGGQIAYGKVGKPRHC